jgi:hypothetical protein
MWGTQRGGEQDCNQERFHRDDCTSREPGALLRKLVRLRPRFAGRIKWVGENEKRRGEGSTHHEKERRTEGRIGIAADRRED